jgi:hypothetical protein
LEASRLKAGSSRKSAQHLCRITATGNGGITSRSEKMLDKGGPFRDRFVKNGSLLNIQNIHMNRFCGPPEFVQRLPE